MIIKARYFEPCKGTVFVVTYSANNYSKGHDIKGNKVAQGVFKTLKAANKLKARIETCGILAEIRVGHFNDAGDIETI